MGHAGENDDQLGRDGVELVFGLRGCVFGGQGRVSERTGTDTDMCGHGR